MNSLETNQFQTEHHKKNKSTIDDIYQIIKTHCKSSKRKSVCIGRDLLRTEISMLNDDGYDVKYNDDKYWFEISW